MKRADALTVLTLTRLTYIAAFTAIVGIFLNIYTFSITGDLSSLVADALTVLTLTRLTYIAAVPAILGI